MRHPNPVLPAASYEIVDNPRREWPLPETKHTLGRLRAEGFSLQEARRVIACVVVRESVGILQHQKPDNATRVMQALPQLPQ